jgi:hypothetical protein|tara:strand:+ start:605 stop:1801 length:1197 start_codon:yes stop_codon:yes gene_type:complete
MELKCFLIEPAENFIKLLCKPISTYFNSNDEKNSLYNKWKYNFIELYNSKSEFLCMAHTDLDGKVCEEQKILETNYFDNYLLVKKNFYYIANTLNIWNNNILIDEDHFILNIEDIATTPNNNVMIYDLIQKEKDNKKFIEINMFRFVVFVYQYLNIFDERSINNNLWNYSLRSSSFSYKCFFIGIFTLLIQYVWVGALLYNVIDDYSTTDNVLIIIISILSTMLSLLYSYNSIKSYFYSRYLYKFLIKIYDDFPEMSLTKNERSAEHYRKRKITMKKYHIKYNWWADFFSNFILPLGIPIINFFIILDSDSIIDAILNSVAIFFIVQIDEDLYNYSDYDNEKNSINFTRWVVSVIYCHYFPLFKDIFQLESEKWFAKIFKLSKNYKNKNNKIGVETYY